MATILDSAGQLVHDTASALLDKQIPDKLAGTVNGVITSGFGIVTDVLGIVRDLTTPAPAPAPPPPAA